MSSQAFLAYLYTGSAAFIVYLQVYHYQKLRRLHKDDANGGVKLGHHAASGIILKDAKITYGVDGNMVRLSSCDHIHTMNRAS